MRKAAALMLYLRYFVVVGSVLLCLLFVADAVLPKPPPRKEVDVDRTTMRITPHPNDGIAYPDMFMAMPAKSTAAASGGGLPTETRRAFAAMRAQPKRTTAPRHRDVANTAPSNGPMSQPYRRDDLPAL